MNIELYVVEALIAVFVCAFLVAVIRNGKQYNERIAWLQEQLDKRDATIKELNNRLMAKNYDQYQMYDQPVTEPLFTEPEEIFNEEAVGKISGKERILDA